MKILNHGTRPMSELQPLIDFVARHTEHADKAFLVIEDSIHWFSTGKAWRFTPAEVGEFDAESPSLVRMFVSKKPCYPKSNEYRKSIGAVTVENEDEEFIFVLAHEFRHLTQTWSLKPYPRHHEVDAERHALAVLAAYRQHLQGRDVFVAAVGENPGRNEYRAVAARKRRR